MTRVLLLSALLLAPAVQVRGYPRGASATDASARSASEATRGADDTAANAKAAATELHDITGIETVPPAPAPPRWPWWAGAGVVALAAIFLLLRRLRRQQRPAPLPPREAALAELALLEGQVTDSSDGVFQTAVAGIVRTYVSRRYQVAETSRTSQELLQHLQSAGVLDGAPHQLLREILAECDLAKFAKAGPGAAERGELLSRARELVDQTATPAPTPTAEDG